MPLLTRGKLNNLGQQVHEGCLGGIERLHVICADLVYSSCNTEWMLHVKW